MYMNRVAAAFPEGLRGVDTRVVQVLDLAKMKDSEIRRVANAVRRGRTPQTGYVHGIAEICAKELGVPRPVVIAKRSWSEELGVYHLPPSAKQHHFAELMRVSDVRYALWLADNPGKNHWRGEPKSRFYETGYYGAHLALEGWATDVKAGTELVMDTIYKKFPSYRDDMERLAKFVESRPRIVKESDA